MNCAHCGASVIAGAARCYRCQHAIEAAPPAFDDRPFAVVASPLRPALGPRAPAPAPPVPPAPRRTLVVPDRSVNIRVAAGSALALASLGLIDLARGDSAAVLLLVALHAAVGAALLRKWRFAWGFAVTTTGLDVPLAFLAFLGGGSFGALLVAALALTCVISLARNGVRANIIRASSGTRQQAPRAATAASQLR